MRKLSIVAGVVVVLVLASASFVLRSDGEAASAADPDKAIKASWTKAEPYWQARLTAVTASERLLTAMSRGLTIDPYVLSP